MSEPRFLFGGAITIPLPERFKDLSNVVPVPDNQEVFSDPDAKHSLIVEILEQVDAPDAECSQILWNNIAEENGATEQCQIRSQHKLPDCIFNGSSCHCDIVEGWQLVHKGQDPRIVQIVCALIRLPSVRSELLLTLNAVSDEEVDDVLGTLKCLVATLKIHDWELFG